MSSVLQRPGVQQLLRFALVGGVATAFQYVVLIALVSGAHVEKNLASGLAYLAGGIVNYLLNRRFTFTNTQTGLVLGYAKFLPMNLIGLAINAAIFAGMLALHAHYLAAQIVATGVVFVFNYLGARFFVFK